MRIGFFTDGFLPQPNGVAVSVFESAKELERRGHEVIIVAPKYPGYEDHDVKVVRVASLKIYKQPETRVALHLPDKATRGLLKYNFDIIHTHSAGPLTLLGWEIARAKGIPVINTYHTLWTKYTHYFLKGKIVTPKMIEGISRILGNRFDSLIAPTKRVERELRSYGVKRPIVVIPSGINVERFQGKSRGYLRKMLGIGDVPIVLFAARLGQEKSPDFILRMFKHVLVSVPEAHLILVGEGPDKTKLVSLSHRLGISKNTHFIGGVKREDMPQVYQDADVFVFSSTTETQGLVVPEALASGLAVVAIDDPAYECIKNGQNGFLVREDENLFAQKVVLLLSNKDLRERIAQKARSSAQILSVELMVNRLEALYSALLARFGRQTLDDALKKNMMQEQFFVLIFMFWLTIILERIIVFFQKPLYYPVFTLGSLSFYFAAPGFFLLVFGSFFYFLRRDRGFALPAFLGIGLGLFSNEAWAIIFGKITALSGYWDPANLVAILTVGFICLGFIIKGGKPPKEIFLDTQEEKHKNPLNPYVSVIVPAYNEENFIAKTLSSLLNQTYKNFELIVVDNNSDDRTDDVARKFGARVVFEEKKGVAHARQKGFEEAKGKIIATTDADTIVPNNWIERIVGEYEKDPELVGFGGLCVFYSGPLVARVLARYFFGPFWLLDKIISGGWNMAGFNMSVRKSSFESIGGFRTEMLMGEDIDLSARLRKTGKIKMDHKLLAYSSGRRYSKGFIAGMLTYAPFWFLKVVMKQDKLFGFPTVRTEKPPSWFSWLPIVLAITFLFVLFYISNF